MSQCSSCGAQIIWVTMRDSGRKMPLNAEPTSMVIRIDEGGRRREVDGDHGLMVKVHMTHWGNCPNAAEHRKRKKPLQNDS